METLKKLLTSWKQSTLLLPDYGEEKKRENEYRKEAEEALQKALDLIHSDGWKREKSDEEDIIYTKTIPVYGKIFQFVGTLPFAPEKVIEELYFKGDGMHKWNPTVNKVRVIQRMDEHLDVVHVIAAEGASGLVASRDFVNLRILKQEKDGYIHGTVGTTHADVPPNPKYVRGEQGPGVYIISRGTTPNSCDLQWLLNTNLKGWIPQYLIDQTLSSVMMEYIRSLRRHCAKSACK